MVPGPGRTDRGAWSRGGLPALGGCLVWGVPCLEGVPGGDPPQWLLLRAVRILLECILVKVFNSWFFSFI